jgi:hypothetical protein
LPAYIAEIDRWCRMVEKEEKQRKREIVKSKLRQQDFTIEG